MMKQIALYIANEQSANGEHREPGPQPERLHLGISATRKFNAQGSVIG